MMQTLFYKTVPERKAIAHKNKISRERKVLMRQVTKIANHFNRELNGSEKFCLEIALLGMEKHLKCPMKKKEQT